MTLTFKLDQNNEKVNQRAKYLGQRSFSSKVIVHSPGKWTHTPTAPSGPPKYLVKIPTSLFLHQNSRPQVRRTNVFVPEVDEIVEETVAVVTALLRPIDARAVDDVAVHDR